jgi:hypothetical protein
MVLGQNSKKETGAKYVQSIRHMYHGVVCCRRVEHAKLTSSEVRPEKYSPCSRRLGERFGLEGCLRQPFQKWLQVSIVQEPETAFHDDVTAVKRILALQDGPSILVAHSYVSSISNLNAVSLYPVLAVRLQRGPALSHHTAMK